MISAASSRGGEVSKHRLALRLGGPAVKTVEGSRGPAGRGASPEASAASNRTLLRLVSRGDWQFIHGLQVKQVPQQRFVVLSARQEQGGV